MNLKEKIRFAVLSSRGVGKFFISKYYKSLSTYRSTRWAGNITFGEEIERVLKIFLKEEELRDKVYLDKLRVDIIWSYYRYGAVPVEYFMFDFIHCTSSRRAEFLTVRHKDLVMIEKVGKGEMWNLLEDKNLFFQRFKKFFKRDVYLFNKERNRELFCAFCEKHKRFIAKPVNGQCGRGVEIINTTEFDNYFAIFEYLDSKGVDYIIEELIVQDSQMNYWNDTSVNTVRIPSFINKTGFHVLKPFLRMGRHGSIVDNGGSGGIFAVVDEMSGSLTTCGVDEFGHVFERHPDSMHLIKGWQVPRWKELLKTAEEVHRTVPNYPYVGWDFALTKTGWVLIEGNWGQFLSEAADKEGIKCKFDSMFD